jgi:hypothetical protein
LADIIVLNAHAQTEDEGDDTEYSFYGELERVFDKFPKYGMKILLGDFNANVGRKSRFTLTNLNESSREASDDGRVKIVKFCRMNTIGDVVLSNVLDTIPYEVLRNIRVLSWLESGL